MQSSAAARVIVLREHLRSGPSPAAQSLEGQCCDAAEPSGKVISAEEAAKLIPDGASVTVNGFVGSGHPELLVNALRDRFNASGHPQRLHLYTVAAVGDGKGRGLGRLAVKGLVTHYTFAW
jgi:hypothetical protein